MKTIEDVDLEYTLDGYGRVRNLGRFEGEHYSTVLAWEMVMDGAQDDTLYWLDGTTTDIIQLDDKLRTLWNIGKGDVCFIVEQSDDGFVYGFTVDEETMRDIEAENERENALDQRDDGD